MTGLLQSTDPEKKTKSPSFLDLEDHDTKGRDVMYRITIQT